jgi:hypothetical protein
MRAEDITEIKAERRRRVMLLTPGDHALLDVALFGHPAGDLTEILLAGYDGTRLEQRFWVPTTRLWPVDLPVILADDAKAMAEATQREIAREMRLMPSRGAYSSQ